ncbi:Sec-independent protein translocase protein TatB [Agrilutibacter solisilvae]|uniref:Sec-independent protein translocase protein TatB n=1 Tax=Agrilutibacter solisilvae TaxID=2763317 RepID=A0A975ASY0_9GAMM|nr:Sec-independent protein translocase protein TatB [Lysobacter solisilvae]QSX79237.1 twin-arginine translocase subunit TatB [Lysobacter solisilvae]
MFDIGFSELFMIALVALVVLGPERLPKAARFAGLWVRRARAQWYSVKSELENELADEELRRSLRQARTDLEDARDSLVQDGARIEREVAQARDELQRSIGVTAPSGASGAEELHETTVPGEDLPAPAEGHEGAPPQRASERSPDA